VSDLLVDARKRSDAAASFVRLVGSIARPDLTLSVILVAFLLAITVAGTTALSVHFALALASVVGFLAIVDAVALNPPTERE
jgi:predicted PurR-regulated permease PerM